MAIVSHELTYRLNECREWWYKQVGLHPTDRERGIGKLDTAFSLQRRYILRIFDEVSMPKTSSKDKVKWRGYINITIPEKMKPKVKAWIADSDTVFQLMNGMLADGYTIKFAQGKTEEEIRCNVYCANANDDNAGYSLGAWSSDWYTSLAVALFKHHHIAKGVWSDFEQPAVGEFG